MFARPARCRASCPGMHAWQIHYHIKVRRSLAHQWRSCCGQGTFLFSGWHTWDPLVARCSLPARQSSSTRGVQLSQREAGRHALIPLAARVFKVQPVEGMSQALLSPCSRKSAARGDMHNCCSC